MLIENKTGNRINSDLQDKSIDWIDLEWYEAGKRILHKRSRRGTQIVLRFLAGSQNLSQGDILFEDDNTVLAVHILPCDAIVVRPENMFEMASLCYEIGNKHLPVFYENEEILVAYESPLFRLLELSGMNIRREKRQLIKPLKTSVDAHAHGSNTESLFSKVMKRTSRNT